LLVERLDLEPASWQSHLLEDQRLQFFIKPAFIRHSLKDTGNVKIPVAAGQVMLCPRNERHYISWDERISILSIRIPDSALEEAARERLTDRSPAIEPWGAVTDDRLTHLLFAMDAGRARGYAAGKLFVDCVETALANILVTSLKHLRSEINSRQRGHGSSCPSTRC
jgi:AraC family transcriptional regulator